MIGAVLIAAALACAKDPPPLPAGLTKDSTYVSDAMPPERFRGNASASVIFRSPGEVDRRCAPKVRMCGARYLACSRGRYMVLPNPCDPSFAGEAFARLACHELGHVNFWPATHGE